MLCAKVATHVLARLFVFKPSASVWLLPISRCGIQRKWKKQWSNRTRNTRLALCPHWIISDEAIFHAFSVVSL